jgi:hypothetical protein
MKSGIKPEFRINDECPNDECPKGFRIRAFFFFAGTYLRQFQIPRFGHSAFVIDSEFGFRTAPPPGICLIISRVLPTILLLVLPQIHLGTPTEELHHGSVVRP